MIDLKSPLFVPFNIRNQIINENCTKQKDIVEFPIQEQLKILPCYMSEPKIHDGIIWEKYQNLKTCYRRSIKNRRASACLLNAFTTMSFASVNRSNIPLAGISDTDLKVYLKFNEGSGDIINV